MFILDQQKGHISKLGMFTYRKGCYNLRVDVQGGDIWYPVEVLSPPVNKEYLYLFSYIHFTFRKKAMHF